MNVKTLIINISTISLIHTSSINDIQGSIIMIRYNGRAVVRIIFMFSIPLGLLVWMRLMVLMLMMSVLTFMTMMMMLIMLLMILTMILMMILMMMLMMILMM